MSPEERKAREDAAFFRGLARTTYPPGHNKHIGTLAVAMRLEEIAAEKALESLSVAEVENLQRLCRPDCPDALAAEGRG